uniref:Chitin-binding type-2 domain-containing protein n=1 Tax=Anopheles melas TaxID=34690 RepID=A0A182TWJ9_9DIPT
MLICGGAESSSLDCSATAKDDLTHAAKFECQEEGFAVDQNDCAVFYRCVQEGDSLTAYKFRCGPGTVFSMNENVCVHPRDSEREECRETGNEIDGPAPEPEPAAPEPEPDAPKPEPQTMEQNEQEPMAMGNGELEQNGDAENSVNPEGNAPIGTGQEQPGTGDSEKEDKKPIIDDGVPCEEDGFVGDRNDCQVFYRCIARAD